MYIYEYRRKKLIIQEEKYYLYSYSKIDAADN